MSLQSETGQVDPSLEFLDENGKKVRLGDFFFKNRPVILMPVYFKCPTVCNSQMNRVIEGVRASRFTFPEDFEIISVSFNHKEGAGLAKKKKDSYIKEYNLENDSWHFLTGREENIRKLTDSLGFEFFWATESSEYIHKPVTYFLTSNGRLIHGISGTRPDPKAIEMSIIEASEGEFATFRDRILLFFFNFNPETGKYHLSLWRIIQSTIIFILVLVLLFRRLSR